MLTVEGHCTRFQFFIEAKGHVANDDADSGDSSLATVSIIHDQLRRIYNSTSQRRKKEHLVLLGICIITPPLLVVLLCLSALVCHRSTSAQLQAELSCQSRLLTGFGATGTAQIKLSAKSFPK